MGRVGGGTSSLRAHSFMIFDTHQATSFPDRGAPSHKDDGEQLRSCHSCGEGCTWASARERHKWRGGGGCRIKACGTKWKRESSVAGQQGVQGATPQNENTSKALQKSKGLACAPLIDGFLSNGFCTLPRFFFFFFFFFGRRARRTWGENSAPSPASSELTFDSDT
jgi:hypothetical protein